MTTPELPGQKAEDTPTDCEEAQSALYPMHCSHGSFEAMIHLNHMVPVRGDTLTSEVCTYNSLAVQLAVYVRRCCQESGESVTKNEKLQAIVCCCLMYFLMPGKK